GSNAAGTSAIFVHVEVVGSNVAPSFKPVMPPSPPPHTARQLHGASSHATAACVRVEIGGSGSVAHVSVAGSYDPAPDATLPYHPPRTNTFFALDDHAVCGDVRGPSGDAAITRQLSVAGSYAAPSESPADVADSPAQ